MATAAAHALGAVAALLNAAIIDSFDDWDELWERLWRNSIEACTVQKIDPVALLTLRTTGGLSTEEIAGVLRATGASDGDLVCIVADQVGRVHVAHNAIAVWGTFDNYERGIAS